MEITTVLSSLSSVGSFVALAIALRSEHRAAATHRAHEAERQARQRSDEERERLALAATELVDHAVQEAKGDGEVHTHVTNSFEASEETRKLQPFVKSDPRVHNAYHADGLFRVEFTTLSPVQYSEWERGNFIIQSGKIYSRN